MALRNLKLCTCCGFFTPNDVLCQQCLFAGCDKKPKGAPCFLNLGSAAPRPHVEPPLKTDAVSPTGSTGKIPIEERDSL
jgi:hypothetical protein